MKITKSQLKRVIKEELQVVLKEVDPPWAPRRRGQAPEASPQAPALPSGAPAKPASSVTRAKGGMSVEELLAMINKYPTDPTLQLVDAAIKATGLEPWAAFRPQNSKNLQTQIPIVVTTSMQNQNLDDFNNPTVRKELEDNIRKYVDSVTGTGDKF